ncbi:CRISPR-associated protein Cas4 [Methanomassiliicoccus luminyensis]|jgi:CRISPR-associated exonuclease Cas4|uniref:CRISPR-associated protein Cas4 n=1 Tax=Methanomassiliicoccus luminyensis TaxID=1080712 RepID=UPI00035DE388|nr:CRISPR-associated protein Cas4 [Methanomassiliicoccus luminyensis]
MESISASDLEKFCYCPLSWQLSKGADTTSDATRRGKEEHDALGNDLSEMVTKERRGALYEKVILWSSVLATALALTGLFFFYSDDLMLRWKVLGILALLWVIVAMYLLYRSTWEKEAIKKERSERLISVLAILAMIAALNGVPFFGISQDEALIYEAVALILLMCACVALYLSYYSEEDAKRIRRNMDVKGRVAYIGEGDDISRALRSKEHGLTGRPDYVLEMEGELVPVEVKTGRVPRGPLFSHILQVAAYCLILEEQGDKVSRGILRYGEVEHEIEYDEALRSLLLAKLEEMRRAIGTGEVHRNHERPGKCRSCSRRVRCPERLE